MLKFFRLCKKLAAATVQLDQMDNRLHDHQVQIEVMAEALNQKDIEQLKFVHLLHETMGGTQKLTCEGDALARLRVLRENSDKYLDMVDAMRGVYNPEPALLRRLACSLGTSQLDVESVIARAGNLSKVLSDNVGLKHELHKSAQEVAELEAELIDMEWD